MPIIKQVFSIKVIFIITATACFSFCCQKLFSQNIEGHQSPTYKITAPLKNKDIQSCIYLRIVDEKTKESIPARFSLIINNKVYLPDSLDENGIRFTSIHSGKDEKFTCTEIRLPYK